MKWITFWSWLIVRTALRWFPANHPWYGKKFTMKNWWEHSTESTKKFDLVFWFAFVCMSICVASFFWK